MTAAGETGLGLELIKFSALRYRPADIRPHFNRPFPPIPNGQVRWALLKNYCGLYVESSYGP
jgi:hypothetical protein